jgi:sugar-specific transcriptional regulator TrmB
MVGDPSDEPQAVATAQLEEFGLSSYAARTFVALASLGSGTARDVSQVSDVPRTRVYDAIDELQNRGLVDVKQSSPKQFYAISAETASRTFQHDFEHRRNVLQTALNEIEPAKRRVEQRGVWTVDGQRPITERVREFFASARRRSST